MVSTERCACVRMDVCMDVRLVGIAAFPSNGTNGSAWTMKRLVLV